MFNNRLRLVDTAFDELALAGRPIPPAVLRTPKGTDLLGFRVRYECALLLLLRAAADGLGLAGDTLDDALPAQVAQNPYDFWRLAYAVLPAR